MEQIKQERLFSLEEAAKWCNLSRGAMYMHYRRGHIEPERLLCHKLYFSRKSIDDFRAMYKPFEE